MQTDGQTERQNGMMDVSEGENRGMITGGTGRQEELMRQTYGQPFMGDQINTWGEAAPSTFWLEPTSQSVLSLLSPSLRPSPQRQRNAPSLSLFLFLVLLKLVIWEVMNRGEGRIKGKSRDAYNFDDNLGTLFFFGVRDELKPESPKRLRDSNG